MYALLTLLPLALILFLLFRQYNMIVAGLAGALLAALIVWVGHMFDPHLATIGIPMMNKLVLEAIPGMLGNTVPILNSAIAMAVFASGGYAAALTLAKRGVKGRVELLAVFIVILQGLATYMSGVGGGTAMVVAPLAFAAVGVIPELIAAMSLVSAIGFTASAASLESSIVIKYAKITLDQQVAQTRPIFLAFMVLGIALAYWGAKRRGTIQTGEGNSEIEKLSTKELWLHTIPAVFLLFAVIAGPFINKQLGWPILGPLVYSMVTILLIAVCTRFKLNQAFNGLIDGAAYITKMLFAVGIFVGFINIVGEMGTFKTIANIASAAPATIAVPVAILCGFAIGVPAGAYVGSVLALILPVTVALGFTPMQIALVTMGVGLGSQMSFVNITMQALSAGFKRPILEIVKGNSRWIPIGLAILVVLGLVL
jgi:hypothetical protein